MTRIPSAGSQKQAPGKDPKHLIVIDGRPADLFGTGMLLQRLDYRVFTAGTVEEALQFMESARPSAIITEMIFKKMSGMDLLTRLKKEAATRNIPVIMLTRLKDPKIEQIAMIAGCAAYLRKPVEPNDLYRAVQLAVETTPRHYIRFNTYLKVVIGSGAAPKTSTTEFVTALSENGIFIRTFRPRSANSLLPITIFLGNRKIAVRALVLYRVTGNGGSLKEPGMGMKFVEIADRDREFIRAFINDALTRDLGSAGSGQRR